MNCFRCELLSLINVKRALNAINCDLLIRSRLILPRLTRQLYGCEKQAQFENDSPAPLLTCCVSWYPYNLKKYFIRTIAGLGGSVGCAVRMETRRSRVQPPPRSATFFRGDWSWNIFYGHSLPSADSRRAVVSFWRKNVHNTGEPLRGLSLPSKRVVR